MIGKTGFMPWLLGHWLSSYDKAVMHVVKNDAMFYDPTALFNRMIEGFARYNGSDFYYDGAGSCFGQYKDQRSQCVHESKPYIFYNHKHPTVIAGKKLSAGVYKYLLKQSPHLGSK